MPVYNATAQQLTRALSSVNNQIGIDFTQVDIHLVNDAGEKIEPVLFKPHENLDIKLYHLLQNGGSGHARQYGIDHSDGEYVMFMDSDDALYSVCVLRDFFELLQKNGEHQIISGKFLYQSRADNGEFNYQVSNTDNAFVLHGKFFQRQFLEQTGLRFHPKLRNYYDDHYFVGLACTMSKDIFSLDSIVYAWLWNSSSLTRNDAGRLEQWLAGADELRYRLEFLKENQREIASLFDSCLASYTNTYKSYADFPEAEQFRFKMKIRQLFDEFPELYEMLPGRINVGQGYLYSVLRSEAFHEFIHWVFAED
jgi:glycosyltransferase involved in cell wall biosynthesis